MNIVYQVCNCKFDANFLMFLGLHPGPSQGLKIRGAGGLVVLGGENVPPGL